MHSPVPGQLTITSVKTKPVKTQKAAAYEFPGNSSPHPQKHDYSSCFCLSSPLQLFYTVFLTSGPSKVKQLICKVYPLRFWYKNNGLFPSSTDAQFQGWGVGAKSGSSTVSTTKGNENGKCVQFRRCWYGTVHGVTDGGTCERVAAWPMRRSSLRPGNSLRVKLGSGCSFPGPLPLQESHDRPLPEQ